VSVTIPIAAIVQPVWLKPAIAHSPLTVRINQSKPVIADSIKFPEPVPWRISAGNGTQTYVWAHIGSEAVIQAQSWARCRGGLQAIGHLGATSRAVLDAMDNWETLPHTSVAIPPSQTDTARPHVQQGHFS